MHPPNQRQRLSHWWHSSYRKTIWWWINYNVNRLRHQLLPNQLIRPTKYSTPPFPTWDKMTTKKTLLLTQVKTYKSKAYHAGIHDWTITTTKTKYLRVAISSDTISYLTRSISSMFLNDFRFASNRIAMLSSLLAHLNPPSRKISF